jgi:Na+/H+ antiporter NhaA
MEDLIIGLILGFFMCIFCGVFSKSYSQVACKKCNLIDLSKIDYKPIKGWSICECE